MALIAAGCNAIDVVIAMETHAALLRARAPAIDVGLGPVPHAVGARRIAGLRHGVANAANAIGPRDAARPRLAF